MGRLESKTGRPLNFMAGELCAPEQSCRTASAALERMSSIPTTSSAWTKFNHALKSLVAQSNDQDRWFLQGNSVQVSAFLFELHLPRIKLTFCFIS